MKCKDVSKTLLMNYAYQLLGPEDSEKVRSHIAGCPSCRAEAEALRKIATALDAFDQENKSQVFYEIDEQGVVVVYGFMKRQNNSDKPIDVLRFEETGPDVQPGKYLRVAVESEPLALEVEIAEEDRVVYAAKLKRPLEPGEHYDELLVDRCDSINLQKLSPEHGAWLFRPGLIVKDPGEVDVRVEAVRLPHGAKLLSCDPQPDEINTNEAITLVWRRVMADWETFAPVVVYQLKPE